MAYIEAIKTSPYWDYLPTQLHEHIGGEDLVDASVNYVPPIINQSDIKLKPKERFKTKPSDVRLPARLNSALIPYPEEIMNFCTGNYIGNTDYIHGHHAAQIGSLKVVYDKLIELNILPPGPMKFDMDSLKRFSRQSYSRKEDLINLATLSFAKRATRHDLSIAADAPVDFDVSSSMISQYTSFLIMIQRLRLHIVKESTFAELSNYDSTGLGNDNAYVMFSNGVYLYRSGSATGDFYLLSCGGHFRMYHSNLGYWFSGPSSYLDYTFTVADVLNSLDILRNCDEYSWAAGMFKLLIEFSEHEGHHKDQVDFMKSFEGFLLNMSDYDTGHAMNWKPILEAINDLWILDQRISAASYDIGLIISLLNGDDFVSPKESFLCRLIIEAKKLSRTHQQEVSALHRLIFYAEVNAEAGILKFLKRVHTPREIDPIAVKNLTRYAKMLFTISYKKKHGFVPNMIGPIAKTKMIESYAQRNDFHRLENLPLSWWDDLRIYNCMDNTLTDDPLEFAKDKGALKNNISYGPGDSRKELLQVLEREDYELKDFFKDKSIIPKIPSVRYTSQLQEPVAVPDPARLIEKEREQKWEARLFANAELENKHSLSLVAARMKKALSYFDEQLMTPTDKRRKALIHEASRELAQPDNYSLLLDIEGHNQSMQYSNTHELSEFLGNLFGFDDWAKLGHYFSYLTVYHYDEYLDKVILSEGQLGGIEGWLNPLWTLHTTLMIKLLRVMTDINVKKIMVYSDDVNAILEIKQASEPMIQSVFSKIMQHCTKFGMTVKYSQTNLSKHRVTMLRQHYADGIRADSTLKRLISMSAANNPMIFSDELEVSGICSSASSAMELSNHHEACAYLKNYKLGLLLSRLPQMILSKVNDNSMISPTELPIALSNLLYYTKEDGRALDILSDNSLYQAAVNDIAAYLKRQPNELSQGLLRSALNAVYGVSVAESRLSDSPDRVLYLQIYDEFIQDLLFFWIYLPTTVGGLGGSLHINLMLSGHSIGFSKSTHYLHKWIHMYSSNAQYFFRYLEVILSVDMTETRNIDETRLVTTNWPCDSRICPAITSVKQSIKSMVHKKTRNKKVLELFDLSEDREKITSSLLDIFKSNFHTRIVQFYHENTSIHFLDLLVNKVETSSGLLAKVQDILRLRRSLCYRVLENVRMAADTSRTIFGRINKDTDIVEYLLERKCTMFPGVSLIRVEEVLYDDKLEEVEMGAAMVTIRRCSPTHYQNGVKVYDDPKTGNDVLYKGELLDDDRMLGHKEELLAAKLVAVTKWLLMKHALMADPEVNILNLDVVVACNLSLSTLTTETFSDLFHYAPTETGGEILHRIPNIRFSTSVYIRAEMNRSLKYTSELNQGMISHVGLVDSNINFDYLRMRLLVSAIIRDKYDSLRRLVIRYNFKNYKGICDVQFVKPMRTAYKPDQPLRCYSEMRNHKLSVKRFRYLSHSYLYTENVNEWALIPTEREQLSAENLGERYINDIILRYARDLDKDYMLIDNNIIAKDIWQPLITKLEKIDSKWKKDNDNEDIEEIRQRLQKTLHERCRYTSIDKSNPVHLALQAKLIEEIIAQSPNDIEYRSLSDRYNRLVNSRKHSVRLSQRLAQYQAMISNLDIHRFALAKSLLFEYIATFHFKVSLKDRQYLVDADASFNEFNANEMGTLSFLIIHPEIQTRILILGIDYVMKIAREHQFELRSEFTELCNDISLYDVVVPEKLPSLPSQTNLTGDESIPKYALEIEYIRHSIPSSAMETINSMKPLAEYAQRCTTIGSAPEIYTSHTGSDSLCAQVGLFKSLLNFNVIDRTTRICDLTAGRGDGLYAGRSLGLNMTSFSLCDTFTRINHHPDIIFKDDYDIFQGATLKFITGFDLVHIDVSFTGASDSNIIDLILLMEENNLSYSIRMNSVTCFGYTEEATRNLPNYDHFVYYAMNSMFKPYQIYLVGTPSLTDKDWGTIQMKSTVAFRAMALSFSNLLSKNNMNSRLEEYESNSASLYIPRGHDLIHFLEKVCENSIEAEQIYYVNRYLAEVGEDNEIEFSYNHLDDFGRSMIERRTTLCRVDATTTYRNLDEKDIGSVSDVSRPYHIAHVKAMRDKQTPVWKLKYNDCDQVVLTYFRSHHPLSEIRSKCNVVIGLLQFCRSAFLSGFDAIKELASKLEPSRTLKASRHQRELNFALKLLVLAVRDGDYSYGIRYCYHLMAKNPRASSSTVRTLKAYKLLSYLYEDIRKMMSQGLICIRSINAISNEIEVREIQRFRYKRTADLCILPTDADETLGALITDSIDQLFVGLERYANQLIEEPPDPNASEVQGHEITALNLEFDMNIEDEVNRMVERLNLVPTGPHNIIYLDDEEIIEHDDW